MKKITVLLFGLLLMFAISSTNPAYSFSIIKSLPTSELLNYEKGSEFIKLSFKQFKTLTGKKGNLWNKFSFSIMKMRIKHDLKKNPDLKISDYDRPKYKKGTGLKVLIWIVAGFVLLYLLVLAIYAFGTKE